MNDEYKNTEVLRDVTGSLEMLSELEGRYWETFASYDPNYPMTETEVVMFSEMLTEGKHIEEIRELFSQRLNNIEETLKVKGSGKRNAVFGYGDCMIVYLSFINKGLKLDGRAITLYLDSIDAMIRKFARDISLNESEWEDLASAVKEDFITQLATFDPERHVTFNTRIYNRVKEVALRMKYPGRTKHEIVVRGRITAATAELKKAGVTNPSARQIADEVNAKGYALNMSPAQVSKFMKNAVEVVSYDMMHANAILNDEPDNEIADNVGHTPDEIVIAMDEFEEAKKTLQRAIPEDDEECSRMLDFIIEALNEEPNKIAIPSLAKVQAKATELDPESELLADDGHFRMLYSRTLYLLRRGSVKRRRRETKRTATSHKQLNWMGTKNDADIKALEEDFLANADLLAGTKNE